MPGNFHEQYQAPDVPPPAPRSTGIVFTIVALLLAVLFRHNEIVPTVACGFAVVLGSLSWLAPDILEPLNKVWFRFGLLLHKFVNPIVMAAMFAVAIVPLGLLMQLRRDPLRKSPAPPDESYWIEADQDGRSDNSMLNQF